jgi:hypothetical protein
MSSGANDLHFTVLRLLGDDRARMLGHDDPLILGVGLQWHCFHQVLGVACNRPEMQAAVHPNAEHQVRYPTVRPGPLCNREPALAFV